MATTLKDIAEAVGLSQVSVSKALRGTGRLSLETRKRIISTAERLQYRPNASARSMRLGRTGIVGFVFSSEKMFEGLRPEMLGKIYSELKRNNYDLMLGEIKDKELKKAGKVSGLLQNWTADGLLINNQLDLSTSYLKAIRKETFPVVWLNTKQPMNCVYFDDFGGMRQAVRHLISLGHKKIQYLDHSNPLSSVHSHHYSGIDRLEGYQAAMRDADLEPLISMDTNKISDETRVSRCEQLLSMRRRPTAIVTYGNAEHILFACERIGVRIPEDLSLIHVSHRKRLINEKNVSCIFQDYSDLGEAAVRLLASRFAKLPGRIVPSITIPMRFLPGNTCAAPSRNV